MSLWTSTIFVFLLFQALPARAQQVNPKPPSTRVEFATKDWNLNQAYQDVLRILNDQNSCSNFYGGSRAATTVLNGLMVRVRPLSLGGDVSFEMEGHTRLLRDATSGRSYRMFERTIVNVEGSFYQRRDTMMRKFPSDVGRFSPGTRPARALILLHELGHLILGEDGDWLLPDDGHNGQQSKANTLRVQQACRKELDALQ